MYDFYVDADSYVSRYTDWEEVEEVDLDFEAEIAMNNYEGDNSSGYFED